jgi:hypothetical protein
MLTQRYRAAPESLWFWLRRVHAFGGGTELATPTICLPKAVHPTKLGRQGAAPVSKNFEKHHKPWLLQVATERDKHNLEFNLRFEIQHHPENPTLPIQ